MDAVEPGRDAEHHEVRVRFDRLRRTTRATGRWTGRLLWVAVWALLSALVASALFLVSARSTVIASHDATLRPTLGGQALVQGGPLLPDLRMDTGYPVGVVIDLGKTDATSTDDLLQRYALLASSPEGQIDKIQSLLVEMAFQAALRGVVIGLVPMVLWYLFGARRRRELVRALASWRGVATALALVLGLVAVWQPWVRAESSQFGAGRWEPLGEFLGPGVPVPAALDGVQIHTDETTEQSKRLVESAIDTYDKSKTFYDTAVGRAADLPLRVPEEDETVAVLVSDRHDNIGMDAVARAIGDAGGATVVLDAGDDTSTGSHLEAFSLDSLNRAFKGYEKYSVAGNHDSGSFVSKYLAARGWHTFDGSVVDGPAGTTMLGLDDPRSSGLGSWRDEKGLTFAETGTRFSDVACEQDEPVGLVLVHDVKLAASALQRGCVGLVLGGHLHVQVGPTAVEGTRSDESGDATTAGTEPTAPAGPEDTDGAGDPAGTTHLGFSYTNGTTGGAAYAIAVGSKPRRDAQVSLVTLRGGKAVGIQPVTLRTDGAYLVGDWIELTSALVGVTVPGSVPEGQATPPVEETPGPSTRPRT